MATTASYSTQNLARKKMPSLVQELKRWVTEELEFPPHKLPHDSYIKTLCVGPGSSIWRYLIQHVYNERYKTLQDKELKKVEGQKDDVQLLKLQKEIEELQTEITQLDQKISTAEEQLTNEENNMGRHWKMYEESKLRKLILDSFRQRCADERNILTGNTQKISSQWQELEQLSNKAEVKLVFGSSENGNTGTYAEPMVLRDVRELCNERVRFFQLLQDSMLKATSVFSSDQRNSAYQHWLSAVQEVLRSHPPNQVLLALQTLSSKQKTALQEKTAALDVEQDLSALGFRYESDHLLDVSMEEEEDLPAVSNLLQFAWEDVEQYYIQLAETRHRAQQLQADLGAIRKQTQLKILGEDADADSIARSVFELQGQTVRQAAVRDSVREQCAQLQLQNQERRGALQTLQAQSQAIIDFRQLVDIRQEHIRSLIKGNSNLKSELTRVHSEVREFAQEKLSPLFGGVARCVDGLRNVVSQEAKLFDSVSLAALDRRVIDGERIPVDQLSLYSVNSPALQAIRYNLSTPMYMAPEELCSRTVCKKLELRFLRRLMQLHSDTRADSQKWTAQLPAPSYQALLQYVKAEDEEVSQSLLPRVRKAVEKVTTDLAYEKPLHVAITNWWEQPAQFALTQMKWEGLTFQQWLQRWKAATNRLEL